MNRTELWAHKTEESIQELEELKERISALENVNNEWFNAKVGPMGPQGPQGLQGESFNPKDLERINTKLEELSSKLEELSTRLYEIAKEPTEIFHKGISGPPGHQYTDEEAEIARIASEIRHKKRMNMTEEEKRTETESILNKSDEEIERAYQEYLKNPIKEDLELIKKYFDEQMGNPIKELEEIFKL